MSRINWHNTRPPSGLSSLRTEAISTSVAMHEWRGRCKPFCAESSMKTTEAQNQERKLSRS
jgi:hypothetical protein